MIASTCSTLQRRTGITFIPPAAVADEFKSDSPSHPHISHGKNSSGCCPTYKTISKHHQLIIKNKNKKILETTTCFKH